MPNAHDQMPMMGGAQYALSSVLLPSCWEDAQAMSCWCCPMMPSTCPMRMHHWSELPQVGGGPKRDPRDHVTWMTVGPTTAKGRSFRADFFTLVCRLTKERMLYSEKIQSFKREVVWQRPSWIWAFQKDEKKNSHELWKIFWWPVLCINMNNGELNLTIRWWT